MPSTLTRGAAVKHVSEQGGAAGPSDWVGSVSFQDWEGGLRPTAVAEPPPALDELADRLRSSHRIHIAGAPGAGKSTLARRLGRTLNRPVYPLDQIAFEGPDFIPRPVEVTASEAREISETAEWISEGIFVDWADPLLQRADLIVWLDYLNWRRAAYRIVVRTFRGALREARLRRGSDRFLRLADYKRNLKQLIRVLIDSREYWHEQPVPLRYAVTRAQAQDAIAPHWSKVVHITSPQAARALRDAVTSGGSRRR
jgi:adenylate kinase family enzyme